MTIIQISFEVNTFISGIPSLKDIIVEPFIFDAAFVQKDLDAVDDVRILTFGPKGKGANPLANLETNAIFALGRICVYVFICVYASKIRNDVITNKLTAVHQSI